MFPVTVVVLYLIKTLLALSDFDPCNNYKLLKYVDRRAVENYLELGKENSINDDFLDTGWYRIHSDAGEDMPTTAPGPFHCGTWYPIWLNGDLPTVLEEQVTERVCLQTFKNECGFTWNINIKLCTEGFLVYYLVTSNITTAGYCFGTKAVSTDIDLTAKTTSATVGTDSSFDPCSNYTVISKEERRATTSLLKLGTDVSMSDDFLNSGWYRIARSDCEQMPPSPPGPFHCGSWYPIWLNGTLPSIPGAQNTERVCMQSFTNICRYSWNIDIKRCPGNFLVYNLKTSDVTLSGYCFGSEIYCTKVPPDEVKTSESPPDEVQMKEKETDSETVTIVLIVTITVAILILIIFMVIFCQKTRQAKYKEHAPDGKVSNGNRVKGNKTEDSPPPYTKEAESNNVPPIYHRGNPPPYRSRESSVSSTAFVMSAHQIETPVDIFTVKG